MAGENQKNDTNKGNKEKTITNELLDAISKENVLSNAQKIINSAVNVLEEEIAAGILAAKKIEKKIIDVDEIRDNPDDLMNRIRRDTHEAIDLFMDVVTALTKHVTQLSSSLEKQNGSPNNSPAHMNRSAINLIEPDEPLKPGETKSLQYILTDASVTTPVKIKIDKTEFKGVKQQSISSRAIKITPTTFLLKPGQEKEVSIQIKLPKKTEPGKYHALLTDENKKDFRMVLGIEVI